MCWPPYFRPHLPVRVIPRALAPSTRSAYAFDARSPGPTSGKALRFAHLGFGRVVRKMRKRPPSGPGSGLFLSGGKTHTSSAHPGCHSRADRLPLPRVKNSLATTLATRTACPPPRACVKGTPRTKPRKTEHPSPGSRVLPGFHGHELVRFDLFGVHAREGICANQGANREPGNGDHALKNLTITNRRRATGCAGNMRFSLPLMGSAFPASGTGRFRLPWPCPRASSARWTDLHGEGSARLRRGLSACTASRPWSWPRRSGPPEIGRAHV